MELDKTNIVIRERGYLEIMDLALRVIRAHAGPLALALLAGVAPMMLLNAWLLADYSERTYQPGTLTPSIPLNLLATFFVGIWDMRHYLFFTLVLVTWQMPLAAAPATVYLGEALFSSRPQLGKIVRSLRESLPQLLVYQVLLRGLLVPVVLFAPTVLSVLAFLVLLGYWPYLFIWRPYLNEVILLERNPMRAAKRDAMTSRRRTRVLHAGQAGDLFARWMAAAAIGFLLLFSLWMSIGVLRMMLLSELAWSDGMFTFDFQLTLWIVVSYFTVVRFLSYVDLRIRREGWEVELAMRAEEARLKGQLT